MTTYTLFNQAQTGEYNADTNAYTLAVQFSVNQSNLQITGIWFYSAATMTVLPTTIALYTTSGTLVASNSATWLTGVGGGAASAGSGWVYAAFTSAVALTSGTNYFGCVFRASGTPWYSDVRNYWTTGAGASGVTNGPLSAPNQGNSVVGQNPFASNTTLHVPNQQYQSSNYFIDVNVTTTAGTPPAVVTNAATSVTGSSATLNGTVNPESLATTYQFNYGTTTAYGSSTSSGSAGSGSSAVPETANLTGLLGNTTYHYQIQATNSAGTSFGGDQTFTTVVTALSISTTSLGNGFIGTAYSQTVTAVGGIVPYTWSISAGALPSWASLNASTGVISGTPNALGTTSFTVRVTDNIGETATQALSITVTNSLTITTGSLPTGIVGTPYSTTVTAAGGSTPYTWSISVGSLPSWATLSSTTGVISGTPNAAATTSFTVKVTDNLSNTATAALSITIVPVGSIFISNVVAGNVVNDYGLDNVPYTVTTPGSSTLLVAYIGWDVAQQPYQSSGKAPAVNVTDSAGNLWRQVGISTAATASRGALWVADNPRQTSWVSVGLTGWGQSTAYMICELDNAPNTLGAVSLDFVKTVNSTAFTTSLSLAATASTTDIVLGLVTTGGQGGALTVPSSWSGISSVGGVTSVDATTYAMYIPSQAAGAVPVFNPTWNGSVPSAGIIVGLKQSATAPTQTNVNMPVVQVEAAFGVTPGDWTQSVDYTWDVQGFTWTDITSRCFSKGEDASITVKRGRQYELAQEETGEIEIKLDNHDGVFTYGNTASPYYPNVVPGVPIRVTAWWQGVQYPIAFGYAEKWPQEWPDMPQWGFSSLMAVDTWGPLASVNLPSAVKGDVRKDQPYAYFPTSEQYEFTTQSLTPVEQPLDANGLIAIDYAFGNNRYGAYRDGFDQPVTTGQALNLLGDQGTTLGATSYTGQEVGFNGPGMFYFDPNIPTNANRIGSSLNPVQVTSMVRSTGAVSGTITLAFSNPVTPGNTVVVCYASAASTTDPGVSGITLGGSADHFQVANNTLGSGANSNSQIWFDPGVSVSGATSVVVSYSGGSGGADEYAIAYEVPGILVLDKIASSQGSGASWTSTATATTIQPNEIFFGAAGTNGTGTATGVGTWTTVSSGAVGTDIDFLAGYQVVSGKGTCTFSGTESGTGPWGVAVATFSQQIPAGFSAELWFTWGNTNAFECALLTAFGRPSSFFAAQATTAITNGAAVVVGINTGIEYGSSVPTGFWVNGVDITQGNFNQTTFQPQHFVLTAGPDGTTCYLNGVPAPASPVLPVIPQIKAVAMGPACFSYDVSGLAVYNGYNFVAGHLAWYGQELTATQVSNHYETGFTGWAGTPAPGRFAQILTWGQLGMKRGGTAWYQIYGHAEGTYISEAYAYEGSSAADIITQIVKTEGGRAFTQGNGSIVYNYRWNLYNQSPVAVFGDNNTTEIPFEQDTSFSVDNQLIYNVISATQNRGPNQDLFYELGNSVSQNQYFMRSGLSYQNYAMTLFDVFDQVNWAAIKYQQPSQRVAQLDFYPSRLTGKNPSVFPVALGTELNQIITVNRRPVGGAVFTITGAVQQITHEIGAAFWHTTYQIAPVFPESQTLIADTPGSNSPGTQSLSW